MTPATGTPLTPEARLNLHSAILDTRVTTAANLARHAHIIATAHEAGADLAAWNERHAGCPVERRVAMLEGMAAELRREEVERAKVERRGRRAGGGDERG